MTGADWLLPIDPAAHAEHQPADWRTRSDATAIWEAIGRSQPLGRWCLRTGYRTMRAGDTIWAYLSKRQEVCARGRVRAVVALGPDGREHAFTAGSDAPSDAPGPVVAWFVEVDWDEVTTAGLCRHPVPRSAFGQVPMSTCRARGASARALHEHVARLQE